MVDLYGRAFSLRPDPQAEAAAIELEYLRKRVAKLEDYLKVERKAALQMHRVYQNGMAETIGKAVGGYLERQREDALR